MQRDEVTTRHALSYATPARRRPALRIVAAAASVHFVTFATLFVISLGRGMSRFDSGAGPSTLDRIADGAAAVLSFPLLPLLHALQVHIPGPTGWLLFVANSLLWGVAVWLLLRVSGWTRNAR